MIKVTRKGFKEKKKKMQRIRKNFEPTMVKAVGQAAALVEGQAKRNVTGGSPLHVRSGNLRRNIRSRVEKIRQSIIGRIGTNVKYAPVHEFGATIRPKVKDFLRFQVKPGQWVSVKQVKIPKRPWLGPALRTSRKKVLVIYNTALGRLYRGVR